MKNKLFLVTATILISVSLAFTPSIAEADIHVYDKNNQYLGIMVELNRWELVTFLPSLSATWELDYDDEGLCGEAFFDSADCSGTAYIDLPLPSMVDLSNSAIGGFYKPDYNGKRTFAPGSAINSMDCQCQVGAIPSAEYYPLIQVQMPFTTPIALPLSFKVETKSEIMPFPIVVAPKNN